MSNATDLVRFQHKIHVGYQFIQIMIYNITINDICSTDGATSGVVVCRDQKNNTYYPISMFSHEEGLCSFNNLMELNILEKSYNSLHLIMSEWRC